MSPSNLFELETLARQRQAEIEHQLQRSAQLGEFRPDLRPSRFNGNLKGAVTIGAAVGLSILLAIGLTFSMVFAIGVIPQTLHAARHILPTYKSREITMNDNPWHVDDVAQLQRHRIQEEMKRIRLEDSALAGRKSKPNGAAIIGAAVGLSLLTAIALTFSMVFAIGIFR